MLIPLNCLLRLGGQPQETVVIDQFRIDGQPVGTGAGHPDQGVLQADGTQERRSRLARV